jgi:hypothetical protein
MITATSSKELFYYIEDFFSDMKTNLMFIERYAGNKDVIIIEASGKTFVKFLRSNEIKEEETFEGAMHKFYY